MTNAWPFDQPPNCAVITLRRILDGAEHILHVIHDSEDHGWQFLSGSDAHEAEAAVVALGTIVDLDPSVSEVADIPPGWRAWRDWKGQDWNRGPNMSDVSKSGSDE